MTLNKHPNIVRLLKVTLDRDQRLYLVFEFVPSNLYKVTQRGLSVDEIREYMYVLYVHAPVGYAALCAQQPAPHSFNAGGSSSQACRTSTLWATSTGYEAPPPTHAVAVCVCVDRLHTCDSHRTRTQDIKPENLLIDADNVMKVADFGEAREIRARPPFTAGAGTRWYMSPELILHSTRYNSPVDIWACGCVFGEMLTGGAPLFGGQTEIDVLHLMCQLLGTPSKDEWPAGHTLAMERGVSFPSVRVRVARVCGGGPGPGAPSSAAHWLSLVQPTGLTCAPRCCRC